jgi:hypothetical protein
MLNMHGFAGYFKIKDLPYRVTVTHPETLWGATSMTDLDASATSDVFTTPRYAELVENQSCMQNQTILLLLMEWILIGVYSPSGKVTAESITQK